MMNESQTAVVPALLIAVAGVLVDATFRSDAFRDRIWAQIALWLAASLQGTSNDVGALSISRILIHGTFFLSLVSVSYEAFLVQCRWNTSVSIRGHYSRFLAPSMILPLIYSCIYFSPPGDELHSAWRQCLALYCFSLLSLCGWRWTALRKRRVRQDHVGMPTVESMPAFSTCTRSLEERLWTKWSPSEVLNWIHSFEGDEWSDVCRQLAPERIPGCVLDTITVAELRSIGLPYGPAQSLVDKIEDLTIEYPSPRSRSERNRDPQQHELEIDEWIQYDRGQTLQNGLVLPSVDGYQDHVANSREVPHETDMVMPGELNAEAIQKAKDVFREQFGLELPEIRLRGAVEHPLANDEAGRYTVAETPATVSETMVPARARSSEVASSQGTSGDVPQDLLNAMPPHVREVAEQQPDLVQLLWKQRQQGNSASSLGLSRIQQLRMQDPAYAERFVGAQAAAEMTGIPLARDDNKTGHTEVDDDGQDHNCDGERTTLLRKRAARPPTYAATR